ncbi:MAG: HAD family phosphatase [Kineosporiaceae bacterium]|nr:HAD family phosphatase [Kineosporiaceae bacterium]
MGRDYFEELDELNGTWSTAIAWRPGLLESMAALQRRLTDLNVYFVGSGGALALAELAALEHVERTGLMATAITPLQLDAAGSSNSLRRTAVVLFSARARHPDVRVVGLLGRSRSAELTVLVTQVPEEELSPQIARAFDEIHSVPRTPKDGFLATNSLVAIAVAWLRAAAVELPAAPHGLNVATPGYREPPRRLLVAFGPEQRPGAIDLEARLSESGLADVQLSDLRNLAHGRHVGLARRASDTEVVVLAGPTSADLATRTFGALAEIADPVRFDSPHSGASGALDGLLYTMRYFGALACNDRVNPGRPSVLPAGRRLYHLRTRPTLNSSDSVRHILERKMRAAGDLFTDSAARTRWVDALSEWHDTAAHREIRGVVLDYDGTCCESSARFDPPADQLKEQVERLLEAGLRIAFASGRGPSLLQSLRQWIPSRHWPQVIVGMYNGAAIHPLSDDVHRQTDPEGDLKGAVEILSDLRDDSWVVDVRRHQITVTASDAAPGRLLALFQCALAREPALQVRVVASGHSVDILLRDVSKQRVAEALGCGRGNTLTIGDRGDLGGNDLELLAYGPLSVSVDKVSPDPMRCWNLGAPGQDPSDLTRHYLAAVKVRRSGARFAWALPSSRRVSEGVQRGNEAG